MPETQVSKHGSGNFELLLEIFQLILASEGDPQKIYPLLNQNVEILDDSLAEGLTLWIEGILSRTTSEEAQSIGIAVLIFSNLIQAFPLGNKASNLEIAIEGYHAATKIFTHQDFPEQWAVIQSNLGTAYLERIRGERSNNLETAIHCYQSALSIYAPHSHPVEWATTIIAFNL